VQARLLCAVSDDSIAYTRSHSTRYMLTFVITIGGRRARTLGIPRFLLLEPSHRPLRGSRTRTRTRARVGTENRSGTRNLAIPIPPVISTGAIRARAGGDT
jgi:hypothetical protein